MGKAENQGLDSLESEIEATRERLADTIDQLVYRASPKTIARREVASLKAVYVAPDGSPRTDNILKTAGAVVGVRRAHGRAAQDRGMSDKTPIRMLHDRVLVSVDKEGERRSSGGIVIPATAVMGGRRLGWAQVAAVGPHVRTVEVGDRVLFDPEDKAEVEVNAETYILMRERDIHAVAAERLGDTRPASTSDRSRAWTSYAAQGQRRRGEHHGIDEPVRDAAQHHVEQPVPARHPVRQRLEEQGAGDEPPAQGLENGASGPAPRRRRRWRSRRGSRPQPACGGRLGGRSVLIAPAWQLRRGPAPEHSCSDVGPAGPCRWPALVASRRRGLRRGAARCRPRSWCRPPGRPRCGRPGA